MVRFDVEFRHIGWNNVHFQNDEQQNVDTKYCQHVKMSTYLYKCRISLGCTNFFYNTDKFGQVLWLGQRSNPVLYSTSLYIRHFVYCLIIWRVGEMVCQQFDIRHFVVTSRHYKGRHYFIRHTYWNSTEKRNTILCSNVMGAPIVAKTYWSEDRVLSDRSAVFLEKECKISFVFKDF
jgi:hypothetical protein